jgi:hypothetical protein
VSGKRRLRGHGEGRTRTNWIGTDFLLKPGTRPAYAICQQPLESFSPTDMKTRFRFFLAAGTALALCACVNPYANQIAALDASYAAGNMSRREYLAQRDYLEVQKAQVDRENARIAIGAAAVGTAIAATAVAANNRPRGPGGPPPGGPRPPPPRY